MTARPHLDVLTGPASLAPLTQNRFQKLGADVVFFIFLGDQTKMPYKTYRRFTRKNKARPSRTAVPFLGGTNYFQFE